MCPLLRLAYSPTLRGLVDACAMPSFGLTNRGCNCTTPCAVTALSPGVACEVDPLCPSAFASSLAASGWWDYCDAPAARVAPPVLSFCDINFFLPQCQNASVPLASDVKQLAALLTVPGSNYTFSFLDVTFAKTLGAGGVGATSAGRSAGMGTPGASFIAVDATRAIMTASLPLLSALGLTSTLFILGAFALLLRAGVVALLVACSLARVERGTLAAAKRSVTAPPPGAKARGGVLQSSQRTFTVPLSRALEGAAGAYMGLPLVMMGTPTYSIRAQQHVYEELNLLLVLKLAHKDLLPAHLALAESDGVFGPEVPGLLFIVPYYWAESGDFALAGSVLSAERGLQAKGRPVKEGYQRRLADWVNACCEWEGKAVARAGEVLDDRLRSPLKWEGFKWDSAAASTAAAAAAAATAAATAAAVAVAASAATAAASAAATAAAASGLSTQAASVAPQINGVAAAAAAAGHDDIPTSLSARRRMAEEAGCPIEVVDSAVQALAQDKLPPGTKYHSLTGDGSVVVTRLSDGSLIPDPRDHFKDYLALHVAHWAAHWAGQGDIPATPSARRRLAEWAGCPVEVVDSAVLALARDELPPGTYHSRAGDGSVVFTRLSDGSAIPDPRDHFEEYLALHVAHWRADPARQGKW